MIEYVFLGFFFLLLFCLLRLSDWQKSTNRKVMQRIKRVGMKRLVNATRGLYFTTQTVQLTGAIDLLL